MLRRIRRELAQLRAVWHLPRRGGRGGQRMARAHGLVEQDVVGLPARPVQRLGLGDAHARDAGVVREELERERHPPRPAVQLGGERVRGERHRLGPHQVGPAGLGRALADAEVGLRARPKLGVVDA
eukprot:scaffold49387_cov72-Phaeocystis_antarctica.AAC.7